VCLIDPMKNRDCFILAAHTPTTGYNRNVSRMMQRS
jgi:hypothetical protein